MPGGLTVEQLSQGLASLEEPLSKAEVEATLRSLQTLVLTDGTQSAFVTEVGGVWRPADV